MTMLPYPSKSSVELFSAEIMVSAQQGLKIVRKDGAKVYLEPELNILVAIAPAQTFDSETKVVSNHIETAVFDLTKVFGYKFIVYAEPLPDEIVSGPAPTNLRVVQQSSGDN